MADTPNLDLLLMEVGAPNREIVVNAGLTVLDTITSGVLSLDVSGAGDYPLTDTLTGEAKQGSLMLTGVLTGDRVILVPDRQRQYLVHNGTTGAFTLTVKTVSGGGVTIGADTWAFLISDGTNVLATVTGGGGGTLPSSSETQAGVIEIATTAETTTGTDDTRAVTPLKLQQRLTAVAPPAASETVSGLIELATTAEVQTGTDAVRAVTPAGLTSRTATETRAGVLGVATQAEVTTGTDDTRALTPLKLATRIAAIPAVPAASQTVAGVVELATSAEVTAGTDTTRAVTPACLAAKLPDGTPLAVARYQADGSGVEAAPLTVDAQGNAILGTTTPGGGAQRVLVLASGVAPSGSHPADAVQLWVEDLAAGDAALLLRPEGGQTYAFGTRLTIGSRFFPLTAPTGTPLVLEGTLAALQLSALHGGAALNTVCAGGSLETPTVTPPESTLFILASRGHTGTTFSNTVARLRFRSEQDFATGQGTYIEWSTTRLGASLATEHLRLTAQGNLRLFNGVGASPVEGANAEGVIVLKSGVAPSASHPADAVQVWAADRGATAGKSSLHVRTEDGTSHVLGDASGIGTLGAATLGSGASYQALNVNGSTLYVGQSSVQERPLAALTSAFVVSTDATRTARLSLSAYDATAAREGVRVEADGTAARLGFYGAAAVAKPTVTGARGGNAALASLLTALATLGVITDSSTA